MPELKTIPIRIGQQTLVGGIRDNNFPKDGYNCFELQPVGHVANMYVENFEEWKKRHNATDVEVVVFARGNRRACLIVDSRIHKSWFRKDICNTCISSDFIQEMEGWKRDNGWSNE